MVLDPGKIISNFRRKCPKNLDLFQAIKKIDFSRQISEKFRFLQANSQTKFDFSREISEKFRYFQAISQKKFDFPGKNWPFTAIYYISD